MQWYRSYKRRAAVAHIAVPTTLISTTAFPFTTPNATSRLKIWLFLVFPRSIILSFLNLTLAPQIGIDARTGLPTCSHSQKRQLINLLLFGSLSWIFHRRTCSHLQSRQLVNLLPLGSPLWALHHLLIHVVHKTSFSSGPTHTPSRTIQSSLLKNFLQSFSLWCSNLRCLNMAFHQLHHPASSPMAQRTDGNTESA